MVARRLNTRGPIDHLTFPRGVSARASLGRQVQNGVHRIIGDAESVGWSHQLHNEPTMMVGYERAWPAVLSGTLGRQSFDVAPRVGGALGNVLTYANVGAVLRYARNLRGDIPVRHISLA